MGYRHKKIIGLLMQCEKLICIRYIQSHQFAKTDFNLLSWCPSLLTFTMKRIKYIKKLDTSGYTCNLQYMLSSLEGKYDLNRQGQVQFNLNFQLHKIFIT